MNLLPNKKMKGNCRRIVTQFAIPTPVVKGSSLCATAKITFYIKFVLMNGEKATFSFVFYGRR